MMNKKSILSIALSLMIFLTTDYNSFAQENTTVNKGLDAIKNHSLKEFVKNFKPITYPFEFSEAYEGEKINPELLKELLILDRLEHEYFSYNNYAYHPYRFGYVFYNDNYFGIILAQFIVIHTGIPTYLFQNCASLITMTYDGKIVDSEDLGCFYDEYKALKNGSFVGENLLKIVVDSNQITIDEKKIEKRYRKESETPFNEITNNKSYQIIIDNAGRMFNFYHIHKCDNRALLKVLQNGFNPNNVYDDYGRSPICLAIERGCISTVKLLIEFGANVNEERAMNIPSPLHVASEKGWIAIIKLLLEHGADLEYQIYGGSNIGLTPLDFTKNKKVKKILRQAGGLTGKELK